MGPYILVIDQATTSTQAYVFDADQQIVGHARMDVTQHLPQTDWLEQVAEEIWATCLWTCKSALRKAGIEARQLAGIGVANQRATTIIWDRQTGKTIANALVWRDHRTADVCGALNAAGKEAMVSERTGLIIHPYYSATKIGWLLDHVEGARARALAGELAFGTVDSYLINRLTGGRVHATDATNASQTTLFNIATNAWDPELLDLFNVPAALLPEVRDSADDYGLTDPATLGAAVPILGVVGNQQAALIGQACFSPGMLKSTYDEHCFTLLNTGDDIVRSTHRQLSTIAYRLNGKPTYALEGAIVAVGSSLQWLHDDLDIVEWKQLERQAKAATATHPVHMVPALVGASAEWWEREARGALFGITRGVKRADLVRAALESVGYQSHDLIEIMRKDWGRSTGISISVDGNMAGSDWTMQFLADITQAVVDRSPLVDVTSLGAAWLAGWKAGVWPDAEAFAARRVSDRQFEPRLDADARRGKLDGWHDAVRRVA
jgi:glycerol kinase